MQHIRECHAYSPAFTITCGLNGCPRKFTKFPSFRTHVYEWHSGDPNVSNTSAAPRNPSPQTQCIDGSESPGECHNTTIENNQG